jgi:hypothetical protein
MPLRFPPSIPLDTSPSENAASAGKLQTDPGPDTSVDRRGFVHPYTVVWQWFLGLDLVELAAGAGAKVVRIPFRWLAFVASIVGHSRFRPIRMGRSRSLRRRQNSRRDASRRRPVLGRHRRISVRSLGDERHGLASRGRLLPASLGDRPLRMGGSGHQTGQAGNGLRRRPAGARLPVGAVCHHPPPLLYGLSALLAGMRNRDFVAHSFPRFLVSGGHLHGRGARRGAQFLALRHKRRIRSVSESDGILLAEAQTGAKSAPVGLASPTRPK